MNLAPEIRMVGNENPVGVVPVRLARNRALGLSPTAFSPHAVLMTASEILPRDVITSVALSPA